MGLSRYWHPPTHGDQLGYILAFFPALAAIFYFIALGFGGLFFWICWFVSVLIVIVTIVKVTKLNFSKGKNKIDVDIGVVALFFLVSSIIFHILFTYYYFFMYK